MIVARSTWCLLLFAGLCLNACGGTSKRSSKTLPTARAPLRPPSFPSECARTGKLTFIIGEAVEDTVIEELAAHVRDTYQVEVQVLPSFPESILADAFEASLNQIRAQDALGALRKHLGAPPPWLFAITDLDLLPDRSDWSWAFSARVGNITLISIAHMREPEADPVLLRVRLFKLVARQLGDTYCGLPRTGPPSSVMRHEILSADELDEVDEADWRSTE